MASPITGYEAQANALLEKTDIIASTPHALVDLVKPFSPEYDTSSTAQSVISLLQSQLQQEANRNWELACLPRPWKGGRDNEEEQKPLESGTKHAFPQITVPDPVQNGSRAIFPEVYMSVYSNQEVETVPPTSDIASSLLRDALVDTINILDFNRIATAKYLIDIDCYFTPHTFVKRATPFDRLRDISGDRPTWKPEDVAVDAVFSQLFQLPSPQHKLVYYHSVLTECFHPRMAFIIGALDKEIRLSFAQRIRGTLPDPYQDLITEGKEKDTPDFKYSLDSKFMRSSPVVGLLELVDLSSSSTATPYANEGTEIMQLIRKKAADDDILPIISSIEEQARAMGVEDPMLPSTDAFVTAICFVGSKSLSHVLSCIERNKERLLAIGPKSTRARRQIITSVMEYWKDQPGIGINIIDKLLNYTILTPLSVIEWALVDKLEAGTILARTHVFEMISSTVGKVTNRLRQIVAARTQPGLYEPQLSVLDDTLNREKADMQALFRVIEDSIVSVAGGNNDELMERGDGSGELPEDEIIRQWGCRWLRAFRRKAGVEESFIAETMATATPIGTTAPPLQEGTTAMDGPADGDLDIADADGAADVS
ncbi:hypothetical protein APSETT444_006604 [Aspergillus pseudonomiae]